MPEATGQDACPLKWPAGWPRTTGRKHGKFKSGGQWITTATAVIRVLDELRRFGVDRRTVIISTNLETNRDGTPRSDRRVDHADPGVAVYWTDPETKQQQCMAIDLYTWVSDNLAAVAATLDAMRSIERHGGAQILKRAFQGFKALPSAVTTALSYNQAAEVLGRRADMAWYPIMTNITVARDAYRIAASRTHPDAGGSTEDFQLVQEAKRVLETYHGESL